jgi:hypothetical protein
MKNFFRFFLCISSIFFLSTIPGHSYGHKTGASWEKIIDNYKIDIGYDPTTFIAGQAERLDFNIVDIKTGQSIPFSDVWVRISQGQDTVFASGIHRLTFGLTGMIFEFPKDGDFNMNVRFENEGNTIIQADFPINVTTGSLLENKAVSHSSLIFVIVTAAVGGLIIGAAAVFFIRKKI